MKNKKAIVTISITLVLLIIAVVTLSKNRIYFGDRITGTFTMTVAGNEYDPVEPMLEYENEGTQRLTSSGSDFSIKGGKYGAYKIGFVLDNKELYKLTEDKQFDTYTSNPSLTFLYFNTNWWHVTKMTLTAEMKLINGEWMINTKVVYSEDGGVSEGIVEETFSYNEIMSGNGTILFGI